MCGNYLMSPTASCKYSGSPPRVRELHVNILKSRANDGITPACAGITRVSSYTRPVTVDHPRVCGNYEAMRGPGGAGLGSPPRVRELPRM